jgi:hypothetical protein
MPSRVDDDIRGLECRQNIKHAIIPVEYDEQEQKERQKSSSVTALLKHRQHSFNK